MENKMSLWLTLTSSKVLFIVLRGSYFGPYAFGLWTLTGCCGILIHYPMDDVSCEICCWPVGWNIKWLKWLCQAMCGSCFDIATCCNMPQFHQSRSGSFIVIWGFLSRPWIPQPQEVALWSQAGRGIHCTLATWLPRLKASRLGNQRLLENPPMFVDCIDDGLSCEPRFTSGVLNKCSQIKCQNAYIYIYISKNMQNARKSVKWNARTYVR